MEIKKPCLMKDKPKELKRLSLIIFMISLGLLAILAVIVFSL